MGNNSGKTIVDEHDNVISSDDPRYPTALDLGPPPPVTNPVPAHPSQPSPLNHSSSPPLPEPQPEPEKAAASTEQKEDPSPPPSSPKKEDMKGVRVYDAKCAGWITYSYFEKLQADRKARRLAKKGIKGGKTSKKIKKKGGLVLSKKFAGLNEAEIAMYHALNDVITNSLMLFIPHDLLKIILFYSQGYKFQPGDWVLTFPNGNLNIKAPNALYTLRPPTQPLAQCSLHVSTHTRVAAYGVRCTVHSTSVWTVLVFFARN